jgi:hypothetical protein
MPTKWHLLNEFRVPLNAQKHSANPLSPFGQFNDVYNMESETLFNLVIEALSLRNFNYFHLIPQGPVPLSKSAIKT